MKVIEPVNIWNAGGSKEAIYFDLVCKYDDLKDYATFYYYLYASDMELLASVGGNQPALTMTGDIYFGWTDNEYAYDWAANELNINIVADYTTTTTSTTTAAPTTTSTSTTSTTTSTTTEAPATTSTTTTSNK
jgi:hypothetical protein